MNKILNDHAYMAEALRLAAQGLYTTRSNPRVGCVIVKHDKIIARGFHVSPGKEHAEIMALNSANEAVEGATVYVSLEPCAHHGNTPPCAEALVEAKVARVVSATVDPNPLVNNKGIKLLQSNNIDTTTDILAHEAQELNKGFYKRMTETRPYITVKSAVSIDGKTSLSSGESKWITSEEARVDVQKLRARSCAIMTGIDTVIADNPSMNVRLTRDQLEINNAFRQPKRVVLDTHLRINPNAKILQTPEDVIIYTCADKSEKYKLLESNQVEVVTVASSGERVDLQLIMKDLAARSINEVLVEAGPTLVGSLLKYGLVDEMIVYMAPQIMGHTSNGLANVDFIKNMNDCVALEFSQLRKIGPDLKLQLKPKH